ncbi:MAG: AAA family ATPase [Ruminobacter sp.]|nr:AAA family ATPase [Ruminobacter sp.]
MDLNINNSFYALYQKRKYFPFVDKSDFIAELNICLDAPSSKFISVARPRRFGKTITARMLDLYYSDKYDSKEIFGQLKISQDPSFLECINKYTVIYWDMATLKEKFIDTLIKNPNSDIDFIKVIRSETIKQLREDSEFNEVLSNNSEIGEYSLSSAIIELNKKLAVKFICIIDEWDLIFREYEHDFKLQKDFIEFLRGLFKAIDCAECFSLVYMTGILPIKMYKSDSLLNNFDEYNMLEPSIFAKYFGFTDDEVKDLIEKYPTKVTYQDLKDWYDGYKLDGLDIYNPNSVSLAMRKNLAKLFYSKSSNNENLQTFINMNFDGLKEDILNLLKCEKIPFSSLQFQSSLTDVKTKDDVICLLVCLGYLACVDLPSDYPAILNKFNEKINNNKNTPKYDKLAFIPNREVHDIVYDFVVGSHWSIDEQMINNAIELSQAIRSLDENKASEIFTNYYNSGKVAINDRTMESVLRNTLVHVLAPYTNKNYKIKNEDTLGLGRADIVYLPKPGYVYPYYPIIIELKIDKSTKKAMDQIIAKKYYREYSELYTDLILVGVNYNSKKQFCDFKITKYSELLNSLS